MRRFQELYEQREAFVGMWKAFQGLGGDYSKLLTDLDCFFCTPHLPDPVWNIEKLESHTRYEVYVYLWNIPKKLEAIDKLFQEIGRIRIGGLSDDERVKEMNIRLDKIQSLMDELKVWERLFPERTRNEQ